MTPLELAIPLYVLVDIGCIECGVSSDIVGIFDDKNTAEEICRTLNDSGATWLEGGQHSFEVFTAYRFNSINETYKRWLPK